MLSSMALFVFFANRRMTCTSTIVFFVLLNLQTDVYCHFCGFFLVMEMLKILMNILLKTVKMILMKTVKMILTKIHDYTFFCYGFSSLQKYTYCDFFFLALLADGELLYLLHFLLSSRSRFSFLQTMM